MQWIRKVKVNEKVFQKKTFVFFLMKVDSWQLKIELKQQKMEMEQKKIRLELQKGVWCGYQDAWSTGNAKIPYDKLLHSSTNIENPGIGLDTKSGITICLNPVITYCSQECSQCL